MLINKHASDLNEGIKKTILLRVVEFCKIMTSSLMQWRRNLFRIFNTLNYILYWVEYNIKSWVVSFFAWIVLYNDIRAIIRMCTNVWHAIVALQLKSATHESSCAMTLNCIASNFTSCFLASSTPELNHCKLYASDGIIEIININGLFSVAFFTWIITRILRLLASDQCSPLHPKALECFNNILHVCYEYRCVYLLYNYYGVY